MHASAGVPTKWSWNFAGPHPVPHNEAVHEQGHTRMRGLCGGPVMRTWRFGALPAGATQLVFVYGDSPKRAVLVVRVHPHYEVALN